ncbi:MAG: alkaline phosphatase family protein [Verrucomicrobiales bacterium]|nr:alkaline phosphatase family protein [Verrucomicrobiales bacterium]
MNRIAVLNVVGMCDRHITRDMRFARLYRNNGRRAFIDPAFPAVTTTAQSNYLTGQTPSSHGIVGNGWYNRELAEVQFWKQSNHLVGASKIWESLRAKDGEFTCAKVFWWYNMYSGANWSITPRPMYPADGRKVFDVYTSPMKMREAIKHDLGEFPFPGFWGPAAGVQTPQGTPDCATRWIADSARWIEEKHSPTLSLVSLPHLDYNLQRLGPEAKEARDDLYLADELVADLVKFYEERGVRVLLLSEYGLSEVHRPIHLNRLFRDQGWLSIKEELGLELLDPGASRAFVVADHQVAHVYINDPAIIKPVQALLEKTDGVQFVLDDGGKNERGVAHGRAGDLIAIAEEDAWFTYYYWQDDARAPDFARTVDIHRKPGYDPAELFIDPRIGFPKARIAWRLLQKKLGFRMLMDVIPLDASLVKGSHGCRPVSRADWPVIISPEPDWLPDEVIDSTDVRAIIERAVIGEEAR